MGVFPAQLWYPLGPLYKPIWVPPSFLSSDHVLSKSSSLAAVASASELLLPPPIAIEMKFFLASSKLTGAVKSVLYPDPAASSTFFAAVLAACQRATLSPLT